MEPTRSMQETFLKSIRHLSASGVLRSRPLLSLNAPFWPSPSYPCLVRGRAYRLPEPNHALSGVVYVSRELARGCCRAPCRSDDARERQTTDRCLMFDDIRRAGPGEARRT